MRGASRHVQEERLVGGDRPRAPQPGNRVVNQIRGQDVLGIGRTRNQLMVLVQRGLPLIHVAAHETVEIVEAQSARPTIERTYLAGFPVGRVMVLTEPGRRVAVLPQHFRDRAEILADDARVSVVAGRGFSDHAVAGRVMVASGQQRGARRRTQGRGVKPSVAQPGGGNPIERGRGHLPAERAELAVARIVDQDEHDIRRALGRANWLRKLRRIAFLRSCGRRCLESESRAAAELECRKMPLSAALLVCPATRPRLRRAACQAAARRTMLSWFHLGRLWGERAGGLTDANAATW